MKKRLANVWLLTTGSTLLVFWLIMNRLPRMQLPKISKCNYERIFFHRSHAVYQKVQSEGLQSRYQTDADFSLSIHMIPALTLVLAGKVITTKIFSWSKSNHGLLWQSNKGNSLFIIYVCGTCILWPHMQWFIIHNFFLGGLANHLQWNIESNHANKRNSS